MPSVCDGPASVSFAPVRFTGNASYSSIAAEGASAAMAEAAKCAPEGKCVCRGMRVEVPARIILAKEQPVTVRLAATRAQWLVFVHAADTLPNVAGKGDEFAARRKAMLDIHGELAQYVLIYADGSEADIEIRYGENIANCDVCYGEDVAAVPYWAEPASAGRDEEGRPVTSYRYEWTNLYPGKEIASVGLKLAAPEGEIDLLALTAVRVQGCAEQ